MRLVEEGLSLIVVFVLHCGNNAKDRIEVESNKPRKPFDTWRIRQNIYLIRQWCDEDPRSISTIGWRDHID